MSFYSQQNQGNELCPSLIGFDGLKRIKERVCIQVNKVYDSCLQQETLEDVRVHLTHVSGSGFEPPLTFLSCRSTTVKGRLVGTMIERLEDRPNFARVRTKVEIPVEVIFEDARGKQGSGKAVIVIPKDVIMFVPDESVIPFQLESIVNAICVSGTFIPGDAFRFNLDVCITVILKIIAKVELLIPAFGFCEIPPCEEFAAEVCDEFFRLPLFPPQLEDMPCDPKPHPRPRLMAQEDETEE